MSAESAWICAEPADHRADDEVERVGAVADGEARRDPLPHQGGGAHRVIAAGEHQRRG